MNPDLELALELAGLAAEIAAPRFADRRFTVTIKPDGSPVTSVDQAVERALRDRLAEQRPDHAILGEEYGRSGDSEWRWYLDPIDGTSHFVSGEPEWMTFVALGRGADIVVGVVGMPARAERWWAARGEGAFRDGRPLAVSRTARLDDAIVNDDWLSAGASADWLSAAAQRAGQVRSWEGRGLLSVAAGVADIALASGGHAWDYAAAKVIVEEAGGRFSDSRGRERIDSGDAIVTNGLLHQPTLDLLDRPQPAS